MRVALGVLMGLALAAIGIGTLRSLGARPRHVPFDEPQAAPADVRVTFRCETCGTEVLLIRSGSDMPPRHCGEKMLRREEASRP